MPRNGVLWYEVEAKANPEVNDEAEAEAFFFNSHDSSLGNRHHIFHLCNEPGKLVHSSSGSAIVFQNSNF